MGALPFLLFLLEGAVPSVSLPSWGVDGTAGVATLEGGCDGSRRDEIRGASSTSAFPECISRMRRLEYSVGMEARMSCFKVDVVVCGLHGRESGRSGREAEKRMVTSIEVASWLVLAFDLGGGG